MKDIRVLCRKCADDYKTAGYDVIPFKIINMSMCDKCDRMGYTCEIEKRGNKNGKQGTA